MTDVRRRSDSPELASSTAELVDRLSRKAFDGGPWYFYDETSIITPGLFWGVAGVGYALLYSSSPKTLPNFLLFDPVER